MDGINSAFKLGGISWGGFVGRNEEPAPRSERQRTWLFAASWEHRKRKSKRALLPPFGFAVNFTFFHTSAQQSWTSAVVVG